MTYHFAFDTETHKTTRAEDEDPLCSCGRPHGLTPPVVLGSFADAETSWLFQPGTDIFGEVVTRMSCSPDGCIVGANIAYDFACIAAQQPHTLPIIWGWYEKHRVYDIQIAATLNAVAEGRLDDGELMERNGRRAIDPKTGKMTDRYSLALCVKEWLGRSDAKENSKYVLKYAELEAVPFDMWPWEARQYPLDDARNTYDVFVAQLKGGCRNLQDLPVQVQTAFCLHLGAIWGLRTDELRVAPLSQGIEAQLAKLRAWATQQGLMRIETKKGEQKHVKNTKVIKARVDEAYANQAPKTETGKTSAERVVLEESGDEVLEEFAEISKVEKLHTYLPALQAAAKMPLNVRPNVLLATGRTSYEGFIQLLPRKGGIRECIKFRGVGSSVDYAAVELSTLAQVCIWTVGFSNLGDAINNGMDPHSFFAAKLANEPYEKFLARVKAGDAEAKGLRQATKAANFGFPGMMGPAKFVIAKRKEGDKVCEWFYRDGKCGERKQSDWQGRDIGRRLCSRCLDVAANLRSEFLSMWPEVSRYWKYVTAHVDSTGGVEHFVSKRFRGIDRAPSAANSLFQGLAADGAKRAVIAMTREMYVDRSSPLFGSRLTVFAHDESIIDIPEMSKKHVHDAAHRQAAVMVEEMKKVVPDVAIKAEPALMRYWYKAAEPVVDADGLLIPWEPKAA